MRGLKIPALIVLLVVVLFAEHLNGTPAFLGGTMSFTLKDLTNGTVSAHMKVLTGWKLGTGPCRQNCSRRDENMQTHRQLANSTVANRSDFGTLKHNDHELGAEVSQTFKETIVSVDEQIGWEQELMVFSVKLSSTSDTEKVAYNGSSWINLTLQGTNVEWVFQTTINTNIRNDTLQRNRSPKSMLRPTYRIGFNRTTFIHLPLVDDDGDLVQCEETKTYREIGTLSKLPAPGMKIHKNCSVGIDATRLNNYTGDDWIAVAVEVKDSNKQTIQLGTSVYSQLTATFSKLQIQFAVHVEKNLSTPVFVPPTPEPLHLFVLYAGATWSTDVFAESHNEPVEEFIATGTLPDLWNISIVQPDTNGRQNTYQSNIKLTNPMYQREQHIACISAVDTLGVESFEQRCFRLDVTDVQFNYTTPTRNNKPYFVHVPSPNDTVKCPLDDTCILPIYVKSSRDIVHVVSTKSRMNYTDVLKPMEDVMFKGERVYKTYLIVRHSVPGKVIVCLQASEINGSQSEELCLNVIVNPPDPCLSRPCGRGTCQFREETETFTCSCNNGLTGKYCDTGINSCDPNPCKHGNCFPRALSHYCFCTDDGLNPNDYNSTTNCYERIDDCPEDNACNNNGICEDGYKNYTCRCFGGFSGKHCEIDYCSGETNSTTHLTCENDGCRERYCQDHGACSHGICYCGMGYTGLHCETNVTDTRSTAEVKITEPTLTNGSMIACQEEHIVGGHNCMFDIYITLQTSETNMTVSNRSSAGLTQLLSCTGFREWRFNHGPVKKYVSRCYLDGNITRTDGQYVCVKVAASEHAYDTICYEIAVGAGQNRRKRSAPPPSSFHPPTPGPSISMTVDEMQRFILYTSRNAFNMCDTIKTVYENIHLLDPLPDLDFDNQAVCISEMSVLFNQTGTFDIQLKHGNDTLKITFIVSSKDAKDSCAAHKDICQNDGICFPSVTFSKCICEPDYTGDQCERGPCRDGSKCQHDGHCFVNNNTETCICRPGYHGKLCEDAVANSSWPVIVRTSGIVRSVSCNRGRPCEVHAFVSNVMSNRSVGLGYTSKQIAITDLDITKVDTFDGVFKINIQFIPKQTDNHMICLQTFDEQRTNKNETCFTILVREGFDLVYGFIDRPHFISPSMQGESIVECQSNGQCRVSYHATPGQGHEFKCLSASLTAPKLPIPFEYVIFSSCDSCEENKTPNTNCTFDLVFVPTSNTIDGTQICLTLSLKGEKLEGEHRCFNVSRPNQGRKQGCSDLFCYNGGFCDGQDENHPVCYCRKGFTGPNCTISEASTSCSNHFRGKNSLKFTCKKTEKCTFPIQACGNQKSNIRLGYAANELNAVIHFNDYDDGDGCCTFHSVHMQAIATGTHRFCVQIKNTSGVIEDELCPTVQIIDETPQTMELTKPHFVLPTAPRGTTYVCKQGEMCHVIVYFVDGSTTQGNTCPAVKDTSFQDAQNLQGLHIFQPNEINGSCSSDVLFTMITAETFSLCLQVSTKSIKGEDRCFKVEVAADPDIAEQQTGHDCVNNKDAGTSGECTTATITTAQPMPQRNVVDATAEAVSPRGITETNSVSSSEDEPPKAGGSIAQTAGIGAGGLAGVSVVGVAVFKIISMKKRQSNKVEDEA